MITAQGKPIFRRLEKGHEIIQKYSKGKLVFNNETPINDILLYINGYGRSNQDANRGVFPDLTGNGYDLNLSGFAFGGMSGWGGYKFNFLEWTYLTGFLPAVTDNSIKFGRVTANADAWAFRDANNNYPTGTTLRLKVTADKFYNENGVAMFYFATAGDGQRVPVTQNGLYEITTTSNSTDLGVIASNRNAGTVDGVNIVFQQLSEYPNALVTDGIDDFAQSAVNLPAFTDNKYSIVFDATALSDGTNPFIRKGNIGLAKDGSIWTHDNLGAQVVFDNEPFAITSRGVWCKDGTFIASTQTQEDVSAALQLCQNGNSYGKYATYSASVFNGIETTFEQSMNVLNRMKNNTLL